MNTKKLLGRIHKNSQVGLYTIPKLIENCQNDELKRELSREEQEYRDIYYSSEAINGYGKLNEMSSFAKARTGAMIKLGQGGQDAVSKKAEMMIMGSTAGVVDMSRSLKKSRKAAPEAQLLARELLKTEENNIRSLKQFL